MIGTNRRYKALLYMTDRISVAPQDRQLLESFYLFCQLKNLRAKSISCYAERLSYLINFARGRQKGLAELQREDIESYIVAVMGTVSAETVNGRIRVWRVAYNYWCEEKILENNPLSKIKMLRVEHRIRPVLQPEQIEILLNSFNTDIFTGCRNRTAVLTTIDACIRVGELYNIEIDDLSLSERVIKVQGKSRHERFVPITARTAKCISTYLIRFRNNIPGKHLFCYKNGDGWEGDRFGKILVYRREKLGFHINPHQLRRTGATHLHRNGCDIEIIRRILGHADIRTTQTYIQHNIDVIKDHHDRFSVISQGCHL